MSWLKCWNNMGRLEELKSQYETLDVEAGKYNRPEFDRVYAIIDELVQDGENVGDKGNLAYPLVTGEVIDEALLRAGYARDEKFVADFKKHREIEQKAREIQLEALSLPEHPANLLMKEIRERENRKIGWRFCAASIIGPEPMVHITNDTIVSEAREGRGLFANTTNISKEDESEDELLMANAFDVQGSLYAYRNNLEKYGVIGESGFLNGDFRTLLFTALNNAATFVREYSDSPAKMKNHIGGILTKFDKMPIWGLFFQILILQGLCEWIGALDIDEGNKGYEEALSVYSWLCGALVRKEVQFCYTPYGDESEEHLKPLTDYLYSTEVGQYVQQALFGSRLGVANNTELKSDYAHFSVSKSYEEMQRILTALQQQGFISANTTIKTFYYRMTGQGTPTSDKIEWIKKGKRRKSDINKSGLLDFVFLMQGKECETPTKSFPDIFSIDRLSNTTYQRFNIDTGSEYRTELEKIIKA